MYIDIIINHEGPLEGLVVVEIASFVAGPSAGMTLAQLGAEVVRIDPLGGAADVNRWPLAENGRSLYWTSLNRGKRSVVLDLRSDSGRDLVRRMLSGSDPNRGIVVDNMVGQEWLSWPELTVARSDLISIHIDGHRDGSPAVDYTVNAEVGLPMVTGPERHAGPVNHVLPAWDLLTGMQTATALLAALRRRDRTGIGSRIDIALGDVALAGIANLGWLSEVAATGVNRERQGNSLYGSYGRDFPTADGNHVMVVALTPHQWMALVGVTGTAEQISILEAEHCVDLRRDESARYRLRDAISTIFAPWFAAHDLVSIGDTLTRARALWAPYRTMRDVVESMTSPLVWLDQPGIGPVISAESPMRWHDLASFVTPAPDLGADTVEVLQRLAGVTRAELSSLRAGGVIHGPSSD